jgi:enterochelin esterase family protein
VLVYLPPGYDPAGPRLPVVLVLPGFGSNHRSVVGFDPWKPNTVEAFDAQIVAGESPPALLVLPDCVTRWGGSQFLDSPATGAYQTYLAEEVIPHVDRTFRTIPAREGRAVVGKSSGGFGALRLGMDRPELVSAIGSHAGDAAFEITMRPLLTSAAIAMAKAGGARAFAQRVVEGGPRNAMEHDAVFVLAASAAYAPEPAAERPHCALPVDLGTGEIVPEVWARWLAHDPLHLVDARADALQRMRAVYLDAGDVDEHGLHFAARALEARLTARGVPTVRHEFEGGHRGTSHRYTVSLPFLVGALDPSR